MEIVKVSIELLNNAVYNPRKDLQASDPEYVKLKNSIKHFGYVDPVIVNKNGNIVVGGHQRLKVLKDLGYKEIDVVYVDLNETDEKTLNIALNKISGDWDAEKLEDLIREISLDTDYDVEITGFTFDEIETLFSGSLEDNDMDSEGFDINSDNFDDKFELNDGTQERKQTISIHLLESEMNIVKHVIERVGIKNNSQAILEVCRQWEELKK